MSSQALSRYVFVLIGCVAFLQRVTTDKVTFPDSGAPSPSTDKAGPAAPAQSRLLADAGGFGLGASGQTRNLGLGGVPGFGFLEPSRRRPDCPLCDPSVYSYCGDRLLHDACCCLNQSQNLPPQCNLADCSFLHAKSCYEHGLITRCCCDRRLY